MHLLLLEDDPRLRALIAAGLAESGHRVEAVTSAREGYNVATSGGFDALILDVMLPEGEDAGFQVAQRLRARGDATPILFLTARADVDSRLTGLDVGGDDYLSKPFDFRELRARLSALVRRSAGQGSNAVPLPGGFTLHLLRRQVSGPAGAGVPLTPREFELLEGFALQPQRAYARDELIARVWAGQPEVESRVVDVYVGNLRRKLGDGVILTVRGHGYRLGELGP
ncbi:response regulator transcription factor [Deinococcus radiopugnans]|uniref:Response regulator transcription factor n=1 Tax=Deinococcus radiopugnans ATCC 19172 TaxID=585398 RepID=A0A5C4Y552_9DEIO|nr:response regulator transcription factor [Deinococcus radiopugnans]MBB6017096.1 two-component system response regulator QseB [Deinococcus radiopugnans ATCC 19172]TNM70673.1 response regulator transcription factor [Deinococcus radiopugnans ATCC 19172]